MVLTDLAIRHLFISPGHNFVGHHGRPPASHPIEEVSQIRCLAGRGIQGDRYLDYKDKYKGQITFFEEEVYDDLCSRFAIWDRGPEVFRRNVITRGLRLNDLIGKDFEVQGVSFSGTEECRPCYWMDRAFVRGAEAALKGRGGLRATILSDGILAVAHKGR
ncbi:MAG: MOSC domain-containing protein [Chthoniobacterales bacterium]